MVEMKSYLPGTPSWVDLASPDLERSSSFYAGLFGWSIEHLEGADGDAMFRMDGLPVAGLSRLRREQQGAWHTYVTVQEVDATTTAALASGGEVLFGPTEVSRSGRVAVLADPGGAPLSIWQPRGHFGAALVNEPGAFCWNELQTRALDAAKDFYNKVFGWAARTSDYGGMPYTEWLRDGVSVAGMMPMPPSVPDDVTAFWLVYFGVEDCDDVVEAAARLGATTLVPPFDSPAGRFSVLQDPLGAVFAVIAFR